MDVASRIVAMRKMAAQELTDYARTAFKMDDLEVTVEGSGFKLGEDYFESAQKLREYVERETT